jgi:hypothetical protein
MTCMCEQLNDRTVNLSCYSVHITGLETAWGRVVEVELRTCHSLFALHHRMEGQRWLDP